MTGVNDTHMVQVEWVNKYENRQDKNNTVYSFEFTQSYFHPRRIWDWFA